MEMRSLQRIMKIRGRQQQEQQQQQQQPTTTTTATNGDEVTSVHNEDPGKTNKQNMQELLLKKQCRNQMEMRSLHYIMKIRRRPKKNNAEIAT